MSTRPVVLSNVLAGLFVLVASVSAAAQDGAAGRALAARNCQACHGLDGLSRLPNAPHIAGAPERYFIDQLEAYRSGTRQNEMMTLVVKDLSDLDIVNLAAYYGAIEVSVKAP